jgi:hypothetical protein
MEYSKASIICHGAKALRIGERLLRHVWSYLKSDSFNGEKALKIFNSIQLNGIIQYPDDVEKIDTGCDIFFQIILEEDDIGKIKLACEKMNNKSNITYIVTSNKTNDISEIKTEGELLEAFLSDMNIKGEAI